MGAVLGILSNFWSSEKGGIFFSVGVQYQKCPGGDLNQFLSGSIMWSIVKANFNPEGNSGIGNSLFPS